MSKRVTILNKTQAEGEVSTKLADFKSTHVQVSFNKSAGLVGGTLAVQAKFDRDAMWEDVLDETGTPRVVDMSNPSTFKVENAWVWSLKFTPTGLTAGESYSVFINQGVLLQDSGSYN